MSKKYLKSKLIFYHTGQKYHCTLYTLFYFSLHLYPLQQPPPEVTLRPTFNDFFGEPPMTFWQTFSKKTFDTLVPQINFIISSVNKFHCWFHKYISLFILYSQNTKTVKIIFEKACRKSRRRFAEKVIAKQVVEVVAGGGDELTLNYWMINK